MADTPTLFEAMMKLIDHKLHGLHTWMPCIVESYDENKQLVDVTPQVMVPYFNRDEGGKVKFRPAPRVSSCPVGFMGAGGFRLTLPIIPGKTTGVLLTSSGPIEKWLSEGKLVDPFWTRRHHLNDSMFIPILKPDAQAFTDVPREGSMTVGCDGGPQMVITKTEVQIGGNPSSAPTDFVALAQKVLDRLNDIKSAHDNHQHGLSLVNGQTTNAVNGKPSDITPGALKGQTDKPTAMGSIESVAAAVTKAK